MRIAKRWKAGAALLGLVLCAALAYFLGIANSTKVIEQAPLPPWFIDVTEEVGLDFTHDPGPVGTYFLPQIMGSGAALFDFDNDGKLDIYLVQNGGPAGAKNKLFRQTAEGRFTDVSAGSGLDIAGFGMGVAVGDVNNDGLPDVYVSEYGGGRFFLNKGNGKFEPVDCGIASMKWGTAVSFVDYDRDGWLDLVVVNFLDLDTSKTCTRQDGKQDYCSPDVFKGLLTRLYRNRGLDPSGKWLGFEDRTDAAGLGDAPGPGLGVLCADFDGDGWPDIFVANDARPNRLWINQRGAFTEQAVLRGVAFNGRGERLGNMGVTYGDIDGSGFCSLFVTHLNNELHGLWQTKDRFFFQEVAESAGFASLQWNGTGFGTMFADFDQDGALDLAIANGAVYSGTYVGTPGSSFWDAYVQRNQLLKGDGAGRFRDISTDNPALCGQPNIARALAVGDITGKGAMDILVTRIDGKARVLRNIAPDRGHWLMVRAVDPKRKRDSIGAEVHVLAGPRRWQRLIQPSQSYLCSNDPRAHFGFGAVDRIDAIEVLWPDGAAERFDPVPVDRHIEIRQGEGNPFKWNRK